MAWSTTRSPIKGPNLVIRSVSPSGVMRPRGTDKGPAAPVVGRRVTDRRGGTGFARGSFRGPMAAVSSRASAWRLSVSAGAVRLQQAPAGGVAAAEAGYPGGCSRHRPVARRRVGHRLHAGGVRSFPPGRTTLRSARLGRIRLGVVKRPQRHLNHEHPPTLSSTDQRGPNVPAPYDSPRESTVIIGGQPGGASRPSRGPA
jgi:hypothetical protein